MEKKFGQLLELIIIGEVPLRWPSGWISPLVVVPKDDADARVCVDTCRAKAIILERHPISPVQTTFPELKCLNTQAETLAYFRVDCRLRIVVYAFQWV